MHAYANWFQFFSMSVSLWLFFKSVYKTINIGTYTYLLKNKRLCKNEQRCAMSDDKVQIVPQKRRSLIAFAEIAQSPRNQEPLLHQFALETNRHDFQCCKTKQIFPNVMLGVGSSNLKMRPCRVKRWSERPFLDCESRCKSNFRLARLPLPLCFGLSWSALWVAAGSSRAKPGLVQSWCRTASSMLRLKPPIHSTTKKARIFGLVDTFSTASDSETERHNEIDNHVFGFVLVWQGWATSAYLF